MQLSERERGLVILALKKVLETEPSYARADEYKKLLNRLQDEQSQTDFDDAIYDGFRYDIDDV
ncbi:hypothetical protein IC620_09285 [Hazenella sp. IB182357]|uniref:Uncharacterized protein n=1 Tax=Polycladospora coralii TaxID=2771432 RepID=A0A926N9B1_9BACL|nr:hypothetical protein [Polycladospora coralii]MBD1372546.1 hypothetical protein [Polycladospora coralii]MBS7531331.1 hypothetical protein [Polycladospora coralii]